MGKVGKENGETVVMEERVVDSFSIEDEITFVKIKEKQQT